MTDTNSYLSDDAVSYTIDYKVRSTSCPGSMAAGTLYIKGTKGY